MGMRAGVPAVVTRHRSSFEYEAARKQASTGSGKWSCFGNATLRTPWSPQNIVSTTAPERAVLSALSLGVAL